MKKFKAYWKFCRQDDNSTLNICSTVLWSIFFYLFMVLVMCGCLGLLFVLLERLTTISGAMIWFCKYNTVEICKKIEYFDRGMFGILIVIMVGITSILIRLIYFGKLLALLGVIAIFVSFTQAYFLMNYLPDDLMFKSCISFIGCIIPSLIISLCEACIIFLVYILCSPIYTCWNKCRKDLSDYSEKIESLV